MKDDMPPREGESEPENTYGLPDGTPIERYLKRIFRQQMREVLGTIPPNLADIPETFAVLADYDDEMASAMTPVLSAYWDQAGKEVRDALGLDPTAWEVTDPNTRAKIETAAFDFCHATNQTTSKSLTSALDQLRSELIAGVVDEGESVDQLTRRVQAVFENATRDRARRIAITEASRAVHSAGLQSATDSGVVVGQELLVSGNSCPLCQMQAAECKRVRLGQPFAVNGDHPTYSTILTPPLHPSCRCSVIFVLSPEYGGPENPEWGSTLIQPKPGPEYEIEVVKPEPKRKQPKAKRPKPEPVAVA